MAIMAEKTGEGKVTITVTKVPDHGPLSSTKKSEVLATSRGFMAIDGTEWAVQVTIIRPLRGTDGMREAR